MARVLITVKLMPESIDTDLSKIEEGAKEAISTFGASYLKTEIEEVAFGLKAVKIFLSSEESKSNLDPLEDLMRNVEGVYSVDITDVRRAVG